MKPRKIALLALLVATGVVVHFFEGAIPRPLPWMRPGLANVVTLMALELYGFAVAAVVAMARVLLGSTLAGTLGNIAFLFSLAGSAFALVVMGIARKWAVPPFSLVGVGLLGAAFHGLGQLCVAWYFLVRSEAGFAILPSLLLTAAFAGLVVGVVARTVCEALRSIVYTEKPEEFSGANPDHRM